MFFSRPYFLALLIPLLWFCIQQKTGSAWSKWLRALFYIAAVLGIAGLGLRLPSSNSICVAVADRSSSMSGEAESGVQEYLQELSKKCPEDSRLAIVGFADKAVTEKMADNSAFQGGKPYFENTDSSRIGSGILSALGQIPAATPGRIIILSDGQWTGEDPASAFAQAAACGIQVDYRLWELDRSNDIAVMELAAPFSLEERENFTIESRIWSPLQCDAVVKIRKNNGEWKTRSVKLKRGDNYFSWKDAGTSPGTVLYEVMAEVPGVKDNRTENNLARRIVTVNGRKKMLLVTMNPGGGFARLLENSRIQVVHTVPSPALFTPENLSSYSCIILENIPAGSIGHDGMKLLAALVRTGAAGLVMTGGKSSFANGGYYKSPLEDILPVSLMQRQEQRKARVAMVIALDRSGSMSMQAGNLRKMDLANIAAVEVSRMLQPSDEFGVIAVDSEAHVVLPLAQLKDSPNAVGRILSIESQGGGIFTYTALHEASRQLLKSSAQVRHIILFADAADAEEPGNYRELLQNLAAAGITVSTIGLGNKDDKDALFLQDIAFRGGGQCYFSSNAEELPRVFAEDTFQVALKTFIEEPVSGRFTGLAGVFSSKLAGTSDFGGYNLCYQREGAMTAMVSQDENNAPLCAYWNAGLGRVAVLTAEADGKYSGGFAGSPMAAPLLAGMCSWAAAQEDSGDFAVTQSVGNGVLNLELLLDPERSADPFSVPPVLSAMAWKDGRSTELPKLTFKWAGKDTLTAELPMESSATYITAVSFPESGSVTALPPVSLPYSPEYNSGREAVQRLVSLAKSTGGRERLIPGEIWDHIPGQRSLVSMVPYLCALAILLLILDAAEARLGILSALHNKKAAAMMKDSDGAKSAAKRIKTHRSRPKAQKESEPEEKPKDKEIQPESGLAEALKKARNR